MDELGHNVKQVKTHVMGLARNKLVVREPRPVMNVAPGVRSLRTYPDIDVIDKVNLSSSNPGKYSLMKNGEVLATLFTTRQNLNTQYLHSIELMPSDLFEVVFENRDNYSIDMYMEFEQK